MHTHDDLSLLAQNNEIGKAERWLKSWCRVDTKKGDRRLIDIARALKRKEIVRLLEEYGQINEFVCATFACDLKRMMDRQLLVYFQLIDLSLNESFLSLYCSPQFVL